MNLPDTSIFTSLYRYYLPEPHASLLSGIIFGEKLQTSDRFYNAVKVTGLLHIVVLSGINITLLGAIVGSLTRGLSRNISAGISICAIVIFVMFVGPDPPITRAAIMGVLTLISVIYERKTFALYILFLSGLVIALFKTEWLTTVSFQLSFGATLGIMLFGNVPQRERKSMLSKCLYSLECELRPTLAAQVITTPIIFWYFRELSLIAPVANLVVAFVMPPIMAFGILTAALGKVHIVLGYIPAYISFGLLQYVVSSIQFMADIPFIFVSFQ